ncbi:hypothetical protein [Serratia nematodiphila]|uniref:hypothetical protein n=1 Tax=Serratia nematodiphila TaxID=458197 RepID=UPI0011D91978|nr:hypothetical protein [Serratia nematodiphila]TXE64577.1 hypothetical protein FOT58_09545 [Serratia nematodiphila]BEM47773.1 hypothetical protein SME17J_12670 [Serratia marcescens]
MAELMNWTNAPIVVTDEHGERHTIPSMGEATIDGDFSKHPYVKSGDLSLDGAVVAAAVESAPKGDELQQLRTRYQSIFGKPAPSAAKAETLRKRIEAWQNEQDDDNDDNKDED